MRHARTVLHVGIANPRWQGKCSRHYRRMRNPQFYVSDKRPMGWTGWIAILVLYRLAPSLNRTTAFPRVPATRVMWHMSISRARLARCRHARNKALLTWSEITLKKPTAYKGSFYLYITFNPHCLLVSCHNYVSQTLFVFKIILNTGANVLGRLAVIIVYISFTGVYQRI